MQKGRAGNQFLEEFSLCIECWKQSWKPERVTSKSSDGRPDNTTGALFDTLHAIHMGKGPDRISENDTQFTAVRPELEQNCDYIGTVRNIKHTILLDHRIFAGTTGWRTAESKKQPYLKLRLTTNRADYDHLNLPCPKMAPSTVSTITDSGAQSSLMGLKVFLARGFSQASVLPVKRKMYVSNNEGINI